eukprot:14178922-Alexandrium_andersonii.AAC.1
MPRTSWDPNSAGTAHETSMSGDGSTLSSPPDAPLDGDGPLAGVGGARSGTARAAAHGHSKPSAHIPERDTSGENFASRIKPRSVKSSRNGAANSSRA